MTRGQALLLGKVASWARAGRVYRVRGVQSLRAARELAALGLVLVHEVPPEGDSRLRYCAVHPTAAGRQVWADHSRELRHVFAHGGDRRSAAARQNQPRYPS